MQLASVTGAEYTITATGLPVVPADIALAPAYLAAHPSTASWTITVASSRGKLKSRINPGVAPVYLYVYATDVDALGAQSVYSIKLNGGGSVFNLGTEVTVATVTATLSVGDLRYTPGVYDNLRLSLTPVTNVLE